MATPIKSSNGAGNAANGASVSPAINELMTRLNAQAAAADGQTQNQQAAFSRWMEKHAVTESKLQEEPSAPSASGMPSTASPEQTALSARLAEQQIARSRQQSTMAARHPEQPVAPAQAQASPAEKPASPKPEAQASKSVRKDSTAKPHTTDKAGKADKAAQADSAQEHNNAGDADAVSFSTAMGDGAAVVRELSPPPTIQPGDSAGMMAWLASLTHGDLGQGKAGANALAQGQDAATGKAEGQSAAAPELDTATTGKKDAKDAKGAIALDSQAWQGVGANAALRVDALMAQAASPDVRKDADVLAGLMSGGALKAGFGQVLNEATQSLRHESATLNTPVGAPDFAQALAEKVSMWVGAAGPDGAMTAELHLNPAEMGPINVKISLDGQSAQVDFAAAALETRQAIEASMPMLSSALNDVGLSLSGGDVSSQSSQQSFNQAAGQPSWAPANGTGQADADANLAANGLRPAPAPRPGRLGGLDLYA